MSLIAAFDVWLFWSWQVAGLSVIPALPFLFDKPVEHAVELVFAKWRPTRTHTHQE